MLSNGELVVRSRAERQRRYLEWSGEAEDFLATVTATGELAETEMLTMLSSVLAGLRNLTDP